jgi:uncharacterized OB-fold protein
MSSSEKLVGIKCKKCGYLQHTSHLRCLKCKNTTFDTIEAEGESTLLTYTILNAPPMEFRDQKSIALGVVEFENGIKLLGQIIPIEDLSIGMKLKPEYGKICNNLDGKEVYGYIFSPIK